MVIIPDPRTSPVELTMETLRAWGLELTEVERRLGAQCPRWRVLKSGGGGRTRHTGDGSQKERTDVILDHLLTWLSSQAIDTN